MNKKVIIMSLFVIMGIIVISGCTSSDSNGEDNKYKDVTLVLDGKSFVVHNLTDDEIKNIHGNNTGTIDLRNGEDGRNMYMITTATKSTTILNELLPEDNITEVKTNGITYKNIKFSDGTPSMTVFKTDNGTIYEITYYNGNDFLFDYQDFGDQMNKN